MKNLFLIGGTMGVGKSTVCRILKYKLPNCVFLDGDWCWDMHPFQVTDETKRMVMKNICFLLNSFIECSVYENIVFCWVMHEQKIIDDILSRLNLEDCNVKVVSLVCSKESLAERLARDIKAGIREPDILERSIARLPLYENPNTIKIDVSDITPEEAAMSIMQLI
jgi:broad-specificity NMP kinase